MWTSDGSFPGGRAKTESHSGFRNVGVSPGERKGAHCHGSRKSRGYEDSVDDAEPFPDKGRHPADHLHPSWNLQRRFPESLRAVVEAVALALPSTSLPSAT